MITERRSTKIGAALLIMAVILRLILGMPQVDLSGTSDGDSLQKLPLIPTVTTTQLPSDAVPPTISAPPVLPQFTAADLSSTPLRYSCDYRPDVEKLLLSKLEWTLAGDAPTVLIVHTHGSESYTKEVGQAYKESDPYRTLEEAYNMLAVGDLLQRLLEEAGIHVIHDRQLHDYPSYNSSYSNSRRSVKEYLEQYPSIQLVLDVHRDAAERSDGTQIATGAVVDGKTSAQIMFLVGTDETGNHHPDWQDNLAVAAKLNVLMEGLCPGITRPATLRAQRFNQDLGPIALLVEVGAAGNTLTEALRAIPILADAIIALKNGANP